MAKKNLDFGEQPLIQGGYILLSRTLTEDEIMSKPPLYLKVWIWLLLEAYFAESHGLKQGQVYVNMPKLAKEMSYKIGYRTVTPTPKEIRRVFDFLRCPHEGRNEGHSITTTKGTHGMLVTICNYNKYQDRLSYEGHTESLTKGATNGQQGAQYNIRRSTEVPLVVEVPGVEVKKSLLVSKGMSEVKPSDAPPREKSKRKTKEPFPKDSRSYKASIWWYEITEPNRTIKKPITESEFQKGADIFDRMFRLDGLTSEQVRIVGEWVAQDNFESAQVFAPAKFRKRFNALAAEMKRSKRKAEEDDGGSPSQKNTSPSYPSGSDREEREVWKRDNFRAKRQVERTKQGAPEGPETLKETFERGVSGLMAEIKKHVPDPKELQG